MADQRGQRQLRMDSPSSSSPANDVQSDDSKASVAEIARLQQAAQARIDKTRHDTVGSAP